MGKRKRSLRLTKETEESGDNETEPFTTPEALAFLLSALLIFFFGLGLFFSIANSFAWRMKLKWFQEEGVARVLKTEVLHRENAYDIEITHQLERGGRKFQPKVNAEETQPSAPSLAEAEAIRATYRVGQLYPCWFTPDNPDYNNVLLRDGLQLWWPLTRLWLPFAFSVPPFFLCRWLWRRRAAREREWRQR